MLCVCHSLRLLLPFQFLSGVFSWCALSVSECTMRRQQHVCAPAIPVVPRTGFAYKLATYFFSALNEADIWTKRESHRETEKEGVQISSSAFIQACGLITLYLNLILCCERDTLALPWSIMHFSVSPFNLHTGPTHWHHYQPQKSAGDTRYPKCNTPPPPWCHGPWHPLPSLLLTHKLILS